MPAPIRPLAAFALFLFVAGCNGEGADVVKDPPGPQDPGVYAATGGVTFEGKPVEGEATFTPVEGGEAIKVPVNAGAFELTAPQGKYKVAITGKAGDADLPAGLSAERVIRPDTTSQAINLTLPETNPEDHEELTPDEVRDLPVSGSNPG